jgi:hypothetical protein
MLQIIVDQSVHLVFARISASTIIGAMNAAKGMNDLCGRTNSRLRASEFRSREPVGNPAAIE